MKYLIVGGGPAGMVAAEKLRSLDSEGKITIICGEDEPPYARMALPYFLSGKIKADDVYIRSGEATHQELQKELRINFLLNRQVSRVLTDRQEVVLDNGERLPFDRLLLATGSRPLLPPIPGIEQEGIYPCWTLEDARNIQRSVKPDSKVVLIGAGFIGCILLDTLASMGNKVVVVESEDRIAPRMMNLTGGNLIKQWCSSKGVEALVSTRVESIKAGDKHKFNLHLGNGNVLPADLVITATGVTPNLDFLEGSGIETDVGIIIDEYLRTNLPGIYAAGDVAQGKDFSSNKNIVHAIHPTAIEHGQIAALNMSGLQTPYQGSLAMNVVDTLGLVWHSFGQWSGTPGGEHSENINKENFQYTRLEFEGDYLIGAIIIGPFEHIGIFRGMIQNKIPLGEWKNKLLEDPTKIMAAFLARTNLGKNPPRLTVNRL